MNEQEVIEGKALLAKFMGVKISSGVGGFFYLPEYAEDWNCLMPACIAFKKLTKQDGFKHFNAHGRHREKIEEALITFEIDFIFEALVNALRWYNSIK